jgi:hypothetical protein
MKFLRIIFILILVGFTGLGQNRKENYLKQNYIAIEKTPCFGKCSVYKATIYANGFILLKVEANFFKEKGEYTAQLTKQEVGYLFNAFEKSNFFAFKDEYSGLMTDLPSTYVTYKKKHKLKKVHDYYGAPKELKNLEGLIENFIKDIQQWEEVNR